MAAVFGLLLTLFAGIVLVSMGYSTVAGILGASGFVICVVNVIWFGLYKIGEWYYS